MYFDEGLKNICIANELGITPAYVTKILKSHPDYAEEKLKRSAERYAKYLDRKKNNRKQRERLRESDNCTLGYLKHLQWQHSIEMSKRYLV